MCIFFRFYLYLSILLNALICTHFLHIFLHAPFFHICTYYLHMISVFADLARSQIKSISHSETKVTVLSSVTSSACTGVSI